MGEEFILDPDDGAIGVLGPAGLSATLVGEPAARKIYGALFGPDKVRDAGVLNGLWQGELFALGFTKDLLAYELLSDPALRLILPAPAPPANLVAVEDNGVVHLSWDAGGPASGYDIYRTSNLAQPYTRITGSPVAGLTYDDESVVNSVTYYYAVVAVDAARFESAWSNQNTDCDVSGPDCVLATPINLVPPVQPVGVSALPQGSPDKVLVSWVDNPEPDVSIYRVFWGAVSGSYDGYVEVGGDATQAVIPGLTTDTPYFFAVEAENTSSLVSPLSDEASASPQLILGIRPPAPVQGLMVMPASGDATSLDLEWNAVDVDLYGLPVSVTEYEIFRGLSPGFVPDLDTPLATVAAPDTTYRDLGAAGNGTDFYYLVRAIDAQGFASSVGRDLPDGISDLHVEFQGNTAELSWTAVTETVGGWPTSVAVYEIHGATAPLARSGISPATLLGTTGGTSFLHVPPVADFYYTVLVVDVRGDVSPF
jgi:hypothetical protein